MDKIDVRGINNQQGGFIIMEKEVIKPAVENSVQVDFTWTIPSLIYKILVPVGRMVDSSHKGSNLPPSAVLG